MTTNNDPNPSNNDETSNNDPDAGDKNATLTAAEIQTLRDRLDKLEQRKDHRPKSTAEQIKEELAEALGLRQDAATAKGQAKSVTDEANEQVKALTRDLRRRELKDAASSVDFVDPELAVKLMVVDDDGETNPTDLAKAIAQQHPTLVKKVTEPDLTGGRSTETVDPGALELARQIKASRG